MRLARMTVYRHRKFHACVWTRTRVIGQNATTLIATLIPTLEKYFFKMRILKFEGRNGFYKTNKYKFT